jgi:hypothetical protein
MGMQMAIPYDIANIFNRPIAGVTSVILTVSLGLIIFFGIITSPFGYFFGVPSRRYVLGGKPAKEPDDSRSFSTEMNSEFISNLFYLMPQEDSETCREYIVCYAHGTLRLLPPKALKFYKFFR